MSKHADVIAWEEYAKAHEAHLDVTTLKPMKQYNPYLKNRIMNAFLSGISIGEERNKKLKTNKTKHI